MNIYRLGEIPPSVCDSARVLFDTQSMGDGRLDSDLHVSYLDRHCEVGFAPHDHWFAGVLAHFGLMANEKEGWDLNVGGYEQIQLATYKKDQHFNWHIDTMVLSEQPIDRKITVVCLLNNIQEFRGGEFEMKFKSELYCPALKKGSVIAFPSFISHRVAPVMQGARYTATLWLTGPKFR